MSSRLNLEEVKSSPDKYRLMYAEVDGTVYRADLERKTWYGGWRYAGSLLFPVQEADAKIKELEAKLEAAKRDREVKHQDVRLIAQTYDKSGRLYGASFSKKDSKNPSSVSELVDKSSPPKDKAKKDKPAPIMSGKLKAVPQSNNGNQNNNRKNNNQNH